VRHIAPPSSERQVIVPFTRLQRLKLKVDVAGCVSYAVDFDLPLPSDAVFEVEQALLLIVA
jgi:hypothetical protein